jgi:hypothetical protein
MKASFTITLIALFLLGSWSSGYSQKLKDERIYFRYTSVPSEKLPDDYLTYSVKVYGSGASQAGLSADNIAKRVNMDAFRRIATADGKFGHLRVVINTGYARLSKGERKSKTRKTKNKDGKEVSTTYYWYEIPAQMEANFKILDPESNVLASGSSSYSKKYKTKEYTSSTTAYKNYGANFNTARKEVASSCVNGISSKVNQTLANRYDFAKRKEHKNLYYIKKHDTEEGFRRALEITKAFFENPDNVCKSSEEALEALAAPIEFWQQHASASTSDKKESRIHKAANYNLALIYLFVDEYEKAQMHAQSILDVQSKFQRALWVVSQSEETKTRLETQGMDTRRYCRDVSDAPGPAKVAAFKEEQEELETSTNADEGTIIMDGDTIKGTFIVAEGAENLLFGPKGNVTFKTQKGTEFVEYDLADDKLTAFDFSGRSFVKRTYTPRAKGKEESMNCILEEVYASDKISLYEYYPIAASISDESSEFAFLKTGDSEPTSLSGTSFLLWKKGIASYFEDCADLNAMCLEGGIEKEKDSLIKAARIYSELCE